MITNPLKLKLSEENISLLHAENQRTGVPYAKIINARLNRSYMQLSCEEMLKALDVANVLRMKANNTTATSHEIIKLLRRPTLAQVILGAKPDDLNGKTLVMILEMEDVTIVADNTVNSLARTPRIMEIQDIFQHFHKLGLQEKSLYITEPVDNTESLPVNEALDKLSSYEMKPFDLAGN